MVLKYINENKSLILLGRNSKRPIDEGWNTKQYSLDALKSHKGNLGWRLGAGDIVLDIDPRNGGTASLQALLEDCRLQISPTIYTAGNGTHYYFKLPVQFKDFQFHSKLDRYRGIDFLTEGRYVVIAGSSVDGNEYKWANPVVEFSQPDIPDSLAAMFRKVARGDSRQVDLSSDDKDLLALVGNNANFTGEQVWSILNKLDPDTDYENWLNVGMALHHWSPTEGLPIWESWSKRSKEKYVEGQCDRKWQGFDGQGGVTIATLVYMGRDADYEAKAKELDIILGKVGRATEKELEFDLPRKIIKLELSAVDREKVVNAFKSRFKALGTTLSVGVVRDMLKPSESSQNASEGTPEWCKKYVYNTRTREFYNTLTKDSLSHGAFDMVEGVNVPLSSSGGKSGASKFVADSGYVSIVSECLYLPQVEVGSDGICYLAGRRVLNTYRTDSVPTGGKELRSTAEYEKCRNMIINHVKLICNDNAEEADLILQWLAHNVQFPGVKLLWSPVIQSVPGVGKSFLGVMLRKAMGYPNVGVVSCDQVSSPFNSWAQGVCVNVLEELRIHGHNRHEVMNSLKPLITDRLIQINPKGQKQFDSPNVTNYICFTNYKDVLPVDATDRRWFIIMCDIQNMVELEEYVGKPSAKYFEELFEIIENDDVVRQVLMDITVTQRFKDLKTAPQTEAKTVMIETEIDRYEGLTEVKDVLESGVDHCENGVISTFHLFETLSMTYPELILSPSKQGALLRKLDYTKIGRLKHKGQNTSIWSKKAQSLDKARSKIGL